MNFKDFKEETGLKLRNNKLAMIAGTVVIASTLFAGTALASGNPINDSSTTQPVKSQLTLSLKNGSGEPINISGSLSDIKTQVQSLVKAGKITQQMADKILSHSDPVMNNSGSIKSGKPQLMLSLKNESGDPINISGSSSDIKAQVQSLVKEGKITQLMADKILSFGDPTVNSGDDIEYHQAIPENSTSTQPAEPQIKFYMNNGSGDPLEISGSSPEMLKSQVQSLLLAGKISQQAADKILKALTNLPPKTN